MAGLYLKLCLTASLCAALTAVSLNAALYISIPLWIRVISGLVACAFLSLTFLYAWIFIQRPCPRQNLTTITIHFVLSFVTHLIGRSDHSELLNTCKNPMLHQRRLWQKILELNGRTVYAEDHNLRDMSSLEEFRKQHPLSGYERFRPYVERMADGEKDVLVDGEPDSYIRTTGTTGKSKYLPLKDKSKAFMKIIGMLGYIANQHYPTNIMAKTIYLYVAPKVLKTKSGCDIATADTLPDGEDWFFAQFSTPAIGYRIGTIHEAFYVQLLFGLLDPDLGGILIGFIHSLESAMKLLEKEWKNLIRDIELGTLNAELNLTPAIRTSLTSELQRYGGNPTRASQLRDEFEKGFVGIMRRIWPNIPVVSGIDSTGTWPRLNTTYTKGLPLMTGYYGCSEANLGISPGPTYIARGYLPLVKWTIMEFIREEDASMPQPPTFVLNELEKGQNYEVVITQPYGLYRYRMGDVIQVIDFYRDMPVIDFMYRTGQMLNIRYEKLDQRVVSDSIRAATDKWTDRTVLEFAVAESTILLDTCSVYEPDELMPYYLFFLEMKDPKQPLSNQDKAMIDMELRARNSDVERLRREGAISHPRVHVVRPGAFAKLEHYLITNTGATAIQYKVPRKLRTLAMVDVMLENLVS